MHAGGQGPVVAVLQTQGSWELQQHLRQLSSLFRTWLLTLVRLAPRKGGPNKAFPWPSSQLTAAGGLANLWSITTENKKLNIRAWNTHTLMRQHLKISEDSSHCQRIVKILHQHHSPKQNPTGWRRINDRVRQGIHILLKGQSWQWGQNLRSWICHQVWPPQAHSSSTHWHKWKTAEIPPLH